MLLIYPMGVYEINNREWLILSAPLLFFYVQPNADIKDAMRKLGLLLCLFLILTPVLAYATPLCLPSDSETASGHSHDGHDHDAHGQKHDHKNCSKVEMPDFGSNPVLSKFVSSFKVFQPVILAAPLPSLRGFVQSGAIRGPPPDWGVIKQASASILVTTARLRI